MKRMRVEVYDDLDYARDETLTPLVPGEGRTVTVGYRGNWYQLDLTGEHDDELRAVLEPYISAGSKPEFGPPGVPGRRGPTGLRVRKWEHGKPYGSAIREFAADNPGPWTRDPKVQKAKYYPRELRDAYAAYLASLPPHKQPRWFTGEDDWED